MKALVISLLVAVIAANIWCYKKGTEQPVAAMPLYKKEWVTGFTIFALFTNAANANLCWLKGSTKNLTVSRKEALYYRSGGFDLICGKARQITPL